MIKCETKILAVAAKEAKAFTKFCQENGLKIYVAAAQALAEWLERKKAGK